MITAIKRIGYISVRLTRLYIWLQPEFAKQQANEGGNLTSMGSCRCKYVLKYEIFWMN